jgi:hypothetical protein
MQSGRKGFRIFVVVLAVTCGRAFGGFTDEAFAGDVTPPLTEESIADGEEVLEFSVTSTKGEYVPPVQTLMQRPTPPAAAPLPVALLPGGIMIAGSFIVTRVFKRKIV